MLPIVTEEGFKDSIVSSAPPIYVCFTYSFDSTAFDFTKIQNKFIIVLKIPQKRKCEKRNCLDIDESTVYRRKDVQEMRPLYFMHFLFISAGAIYVYVIRSSFF